jgi:hypothetical protein
MKIGWQLKEEVPLFIIVLVIVGVLTYFYINDPMIAFGTGFLIAAIITSLEVIVHALQKKKK